MRASRRGGLCEKPIDNFGVRGLRDDHFGAESARGGEDRRVANNKPVAERGFNHGGGDAWCGAKGMEQPEEIVGGVGLGEEHGPSERGLAIDVDSEIFTAVES